MSSWKRFIKKIIAKLPSRLQKNIYLIWYHLKKPISFRRPISTIDFILGPEAKAVRLIGFLKIHNEAESGNLLRVLKHMQKFCDGIVVCDCKSTDNSVEIAKKFTSHILHEPNDFKRELFTKQKMLEYTLKLNPDWIVWLDADEVFDREGELGEIRRLCAYGDKNGIDGFSFKEYNLWKSKEKYRVDELFAKAWFVRLWKNNGFLKFNLREGLHNRGYPLGIRNIKRSNIKVIHYGFSTPEFIEEKYQRYKTHGQQGFYLERLKDEKGIKLEPFNIDWFPLSTFETELDSESQLLKQATTPPLHINIVTVNSGWILQKIAGYISDALRKTGIDVTLALEPRQDCDANFYIDIQNCFQSKTKALDIGLFTHLHADDVKNIKSHWLRLDFIMHMCQRYYRAFSQVYPAERMTVLYPGEILDRFTNKRKVKIGIVQRGEYEGKGFFFMLNLFDEPNSLLREWLHFIFVGKGWDDVVKRYRSLGIEVTHLKNESYQAYYDYYQQIDYLLIPSLWEGGPMSLIEAYSQSIPIIAADVGWVPDHFVDEPWMMFSPGDKRALLDILERICSQSATRRAVAEKFSYANYASKVVSIIRNLKETQT